MLGVGNPRRGEPGELLGELEGMKGGARGEPVTCVAGRVGIKPQKGNKLEEELLRCQIELGEGADGTLPEGGKSAPEEDGSLVEKECWGSLF